MKQPLKIGTRESELAVWQATQVQNLLKENGITSELIYIKSEGDIDTVTPLYALGVQGIFTKTLDTALLNNRIDIVVHSMKDVPTQLAKEIKQAAVLKRGNYKDIFVPHPDVPNANEIFGMGVIEIKDISFTSGGSKKKETLHSTSLDTGPRVHAIIATSSIRRIAQWRRRYPTHEIENLRGNVNTRLRKLKESSWHGAIFAAAGLERINLRPENAVELDWMLPAPAQGAIMVVCREDDAYAFECCQPFNDEETALCTKIERDFLNGLMGGCSTPISALAQIKYGEVTFAGEIINPDNLMQQAGIQGGTTIADASDMGFKFAQKLLSGGGQEIIENMRNKG